MIMQFVPIFYDIPTIKRGYPSITCLSDETISSMKNIIMDYLICPVPSQLRLRNHAGSAALHGCGKSSMIWPFIKIGACGGSVSAARGGLIGSAPSVRHSVSGGGACAGRRRTGV